jgi:hypothetical protein
VRAVSRSAETAGGKCRLILGRVSRVRRKYAYAATQADAVDLLRRLGGRAADGQLLATSTPSVATYLDGWFRTDSETWRPSTRRGYRAAIDNYLTREYAA